jgi:hypothetical protein
LVFWWVGSRGRAAGRRMKTGEKVGGRTSVEVGHPSVGESGYWWVRGVAVGGVVGVLVWVLWEYEME